MEVFVECYSGYKYAQEPRAFTWHGQRHVVRAVKRTWLAPEGPHFLVSTEQGNSFELVYYEAEDAWRAKEHSHKHGS